MHTLILFEAAARHLNFSKAATELSITQPAVSHGIRQLELALGHSLFVREHRNLSLTSQEVRLHGAVASGFGAILETLAEISGATSCEEDFSRQPITVETDPKTSRIVRSVCDRLYRVLPACQDGSILAINYSSSEQLSSLAVEVLLSEAGVSDRYRSKRLPIFLNQSNPKAVGTT